MRDDDRMLDLPDAQFGSGIVGVCDICGKRQAVIVLQKERYRLCVIDFLNKTWLKSEKKPTAPAPLYRSDRIWYPTTGTAEGRAPAITLTPTKTVRHPVVLVAPDVYGITTTLLDGAIRFAREGFEVLIPDVSKTDGIGFAHHATLRAGRAFRGGVPASAAKVTQLLTLYKDALRTLLAREMVDPARAAVFGTSYGATLALAVAAESTSITAVALAYPMPVVPPNLPSLVTAPLLLIRGSSDRAAARAEAQVRASEAASRATFVEVPGVRHDFLSRDVRAYDMPAAERAWAEIVGFLRQRLMPPPPRPPPPPTKQAAVAATPAAPAAPASSPSGPEPPALAHRPAAPAS